MDDGYGLAATRYRQGCILSWLALALLLSACVGGGGEGSARKTTDGGALSGAATSAELHEHAIGSVKGKTIAWVPVGLGTPLTEEWTRRIKMGAEALGMKFVLRDSNWDPRREAEAVQSLINEHPDVLVVHNFDVQLLAKLIQRAEQQGIYVIQVNMVSNYKSDAFVGADFIEVGRRVAEDIVDACGGGRSSGKIAIVQGDLTSGVSLELIEGATPVLEKHPEIKIVSNQAGNWDRTKAHDVTATVLKQNPDLCATWGFWDQMQYGAATAVAEAGLAGKVKVFTSDHSTIACQAIGQGLITESYGYSVPEQGEAIVTVANWLLQSGLKPGTVRAAIYSRLVKIDKSNWNRPGTCYDGKGGGSL
jgi:ribose transport system substrate-binding protein